MPSGQAPEEALKDLARSWQRERRRVLRDPAPEAVHRLRTATRRLEAGATIAAEWLGLTSPVPWSDWDGLRIKLSRLRDLDVTCGLLREAHTRGGSEHQALGRRIRALDHDRRRTRRRALAALHRRRSRRVPRVLKHPATGPAEPADLPAAARAWWAAVAGRLADEPAWGHPLAEALRLKAGRQEVHQVRIRVRELRYGLEWWHQLGLVAHPPVIAFLRDIQDTLGQIRDYHRAIEALAGPALRASRAAVTALRATELARWPSVAARRDLLGSSPFEMDQP
jgi:CHAD domain-containing protein